MIMMVMMMVMMTMIMMAMAVKSNMNLDKRPGRKSPLETSCRDLARTRFTPIWPRRIIVSFKTSFLSQFDESHHSDQFFSQIKNSDGDYYLIVQDLHYLFDMSQKFQHPNMFQISAN